MSHPRALVLLAALLSTLGAPVALGEAIKSSDYMLPEELPAPTQAERTMTSAPFSPGAPAVVLFEGLQWEQETASVRLRYVRRVKILTEAGATDNGDWSTAWFGEARP